MYCPSYGVTGQYSMVLHQAGRVARGGERRLKGVARALEEE